MVVVPTMLSNPEGVADLLEGLEVRYLANRDDNVHFALLTDFLDAARGGHGGGRGTGAAGTGRHRASQSEVRESSARPFFPLPSAAALECAGRGVDGVRTQTRQAGGVQRAAARSAAEGTATFAQVVGETAVLPGVRYVITLDTDTQLPRDSVRKMVGTMAHPLNRPVFDAARRRVVDGYGILQPRVGVSLPTSQRSWFRAPVRRGPGC